jgi:hypothetical protein
MKKTLLNFLGHPCSDNVSNESTLRMDFSKTRDFGNDFSKSGNSKSKGVTGILVLLALFLFSNFITAQTITIDGLTNSTPGEWNQAGITHVPDSFNIIGADDIFAGNEKDFFYASNWFWKYGTAKDKNDIANGAAAILQAGQVLDAEGDPVPGGPFIVFAGDRISNSGDAQIGFWFFQDGTSPITTAGGVKTFAPEKHVPPVVGDILVLADFTNGGNIGNITVLEWRGTGGNFSNPAFSVIALSACVA